ncbi:hypothetical protein BUALT_Bualt02G0204100 [Buddleja alternifolia]|uniref:NAC domain-containing protein n=1 Tax=Buddleja alternifolia TaxID=168488 RepID=A0AAV6Y317_9LAMI|nr:hypothetical protein BUALT_Bualt02G0204100 [Buddleja alternifolia]
MGLRDIGKTLPPGFRFYPNDEELVCHYLYKKVANEEGDFRGTLMEIDLHICEPWQLPEVAKLNSNEWYFFSFRDRKYATGFRTNRATTSGYWKATGKDRSILDPRTRVVVGMRKTLVFYKNRAPNGIKTGWIMHEFRLENPHVPPKEDWVLCRVFHKSRSGENKYNNFHDSTAVATSPNLAGYHQNNITSFSHSPSHDQHQSGQNPNTSICLSSAQLDPTGYLQLMNEPNLSISTKCEDDYGFLFDFDNSNGRVPSNLDDMRFVDHVDHDHNSSVFI